MTDLDELERLRGVYDRATKCTSLIGAARLSLILNARAAYETALFAAAEELVRDARRYRDLMAAARQAVLALAHASEYNPRYIRDYERLSDAIDAAIAQEQP